MKYILYASLFLNLLCAGKFAMRFIPKPQEAPKPAFRNPYFAERYYMVQQLPTDTASIVFVGDSHTNNFEFAEYFHNCHIQNRGVGGDSSKEILARIKPIAKGKPRKVFLQMGANDIIKEYSIDSLIIRYKEVIDILRSSSTQTEVIVQALVPMSLPTHQVKVLEANRLLSKYCQDNQIRFIDIAAHFPTEPLVRDEVHLNYAAYLAWMKQIEPYL